MDPLYLLYNKLCVLVIGLVACIMVCPESVTDRPIAVVRSF